MIREYIVNISSEVIEDTFEEHPPELVRCKDCKHWQRRECGGYGTCDNWHLDGFFDADWFCADAERKDNE